jgi:hypothetical protein
MYDYNMCLRRYSQVSERVEELEESHSKCDGAEHRVKVMFQTFGVSVRFRDQSLFMGWGGGGGGGGVGTKEKCFSW